MVRVPEEESANSAVGSRRSNVTVQGIARRIDDLGRIVIPKEYRRIFGIEVGDHLDMTLAGDGIMVRKVQHSCVFCGSQDDLGMFRNRLICGECVQALRQT
jgi:AbrB family transcriptional regulator, transcriptional pleiotropic regulator of transition state genes